MFGMSNQEEGKKEDDFLFDIEESVKKDPNKAKEMQEHALGLLREIKQKMDAGVSKDELPTYQKLIMGYMAYAKIVAAMSVKVKK
jgi:hypothetical protein